MERDRDRAERARRLLDEAKERERRAALGWLSAEKARQEEATQRRRLEAPALVEATERILRALETAGFPGLASVSVGHRKLFDRNSYKFREEPGWELIDKPADVSNDNGSRGQKVWLLAEGTYYVQTSTFGTRMASFTYDIFSPEEYANKYGNDIISSLDEIEATYLRPPQRS